MEKKDTITTYSQISFAPLAPDPAGIKLKDIAHSLSMLCRANGHFDRFFSVAQHCINCAVEAKARGYTKKVQLACLLHDASEAYISDITRPVKKNLPEYIRIESNLQKCIWETFDIHLSGEETEQMSDVDDVMLYAEFNSFMHVRIFPNEPEMRSTPNFESKDFKEVEIAFIELCVELMG